MKQSYQTPTKQTTAVPFSTRPLQFKVELNETIITAADYLNGKSGVKTLNTGVLLVYGEAFADGTKVSAHINRCVFKGVDVTAILKHFDNWSTIEDAALNAATSLFTQNMEG